MKIMYALKVELMCPLGSPNTQKHLSFSKFAIIKGLGSL